MLILRRQLKEATPPAPQAKTYGDIEGYWTTFSKVPVGGKFCTTTQLVINPDCHYVRLVGNSAAIMRGHTYANRDTYFHGDKHVYLFTEKPAPLIRVGESFTTSTHTVLP